MSKAASSPSRSEYAKSEVTCIAERKRAFDGRWKCQSQEGADCVWLLLTPAGSEAMEVNSTAEPAAHHHADMAAVELAWLR